MRNVSRRVRSASLSSKLHDRSSGIYGVAHLVDSFVGGLRLLLGSAWSRRGFDWNRYVFKTSPSGEGAGGRSVKQRIIAGSQRCYQVGSKRC